MTWYRQVHQDKVLAACINWEASTPAAIDVRFTQIYRTHPDSDAPIFISKLMGSALHACNKVRKQRSLDCECTEVDKNGEAVLKVPDAFFEEML